MTKDDIMKMARDAGAPDPMVFIGVYERFYALAAAAEREACAKIAEFTDLHEGDCLKNSDPRKTCAEAIRARSQK